MTLLCLICCNLQNGSTKLLILIIKMSLYQHFQVIRCCHSTTTLHFCGINITAHTLFRLKVKNFTNSIKYSTQQLYLSTFIISEIQLNSNLIFWVVAPFLLFSLYCREYRIRNNGLMGVGVKEPIHEAIIVDLDSASAYRFLK